MTIWARVDSDMPTDGKLLGQPVATRHLWTCLICLARKQDEHGVIRGYDRPLLSGAFNLPRKAVADGLTHFQAVKMIEVDADGTIRLVNFSKWQGDKSLADLRTEWRLRQDKARGVTRDNPPPSRVTPTPVTRVNHATEVVVEVEDQAVKAKATSKSIAAGVAARPSAAVEKPAGEGERGISTPTWEAYRQAYRERYGTDPVRNKPTNAKLVQFVQRIGAEESPHVAAFYLQHNSAKYVSNGHSVGLMLYDAEKLRTEWATDTKITGVQARQLERTQANGDVFKSFLKEG